MIYRSKKENGIFVKIDPYISYQERDIDANIVKNGGGVLFAVNILDSNNLKDYYNLLGVESTGDYKLVDSLIFNDDFLINSSGKIFGKMIINYDVYQFNLKNNVNVHVSSNDKNKLPIVWDLKYGKGYVGVSNSSLISSKNGRGIFVSLYSAIHDVFVYPVINSAVYFIDDFPSPIPNGTDKIIYDEYGYNVKDFYSNVWWPSMRALTKDKGIKLNFIKIDSLEKAKNSPCIFNNWANFYKGKFVSNTILNANAFEKLIK